MVTTGNVNHNHCVKADPKDPLPFCYTTDPNVRYEHCDCGDSITADNYSDDQYNEDGPGLYAGYDRYHPYGHGPYNPSNSGYNPWVINPFNQYRQYGFGRQQESSRRRQQGLCRSSTTLKGIAIWNSAISGIKIQSILCFN